MPPWVPEVPERKPLLHGNDGSSLFSGDLFADGLGVSAVGGAPILCDVSCGWRRGCLAGGHFDAFRGAGNLRALAAALEELVLDG